jgi:hypothetical protein
MQYQNKIEQCLKEIRELEKTFREAQSKEMLPISFFSSAIGLLNRLKTGVYEIETLQFHVMEEHLKRRENDWNETVEIAGNRKNEEPVESKAAEEKTLPSTNFLADTIGRKINADFGKSLSLNDRFMFQRDLFQGNSDEMNQAFAQLDSFRSQDEALQFLSGKYDIPWKSDSGIALKELLDKRFT